MNTIKAVWGCAGCLEELRFRANRGAEEGAGQMGQSVCWSLGKQ